MTTLNPNAVVFVAITTLIGYLAGSWAIGLLIGLTIVFVVSIHG